MLVEGTVVRCQHVQGKVHEIGVQFDSTVSVCDYTSDCSIEDDADDSPVASPKFVGKGMYVEARHIDRELLRFVLADYGAELAFASNDTEAVEMLGKSTYDIVFVGEEHEGVVEQLRKANYPGPIVYLTAEEGGDTAERVTTAGATELLVKPYAPGDLAQLLQTYLRLDPSQLGLEALVSTNWTNVKMRPLVLNYLGTLEEQVTKLERFAAGDDLKAMHGIIHAIKGDAGSYGYPQISDLARTLFALTDDGAQAEQWQTTFNELKNLCLRACLVRHENAG